MRYTCHTSYIVRRTLYIVRCTVVPLHRCTVALTWHSPSYGAVPGTNRWEFKGGGIMIHKFVKLQRLGCIGLHRIRLVMWLANKDSNPQVGRLSVHNININSFACKFAISIVNAISIINIIINTIAMSVFTVSSRFLFLPSRCAPVVRRYACTYALCAPVA